ncbi:MAG: hypothetical protein L6R28_15460 [Planctomycetes bacterium]|nr:hypothetical protein [Planctomycetota bacterium]
MAHSMRVAFAAAVLLAAACPLSVLRAGEPKKDPAETVVIDPPEAAAESAIVSNTLFRVSDSEQIWNAAHRRATETTEGQGQGFLSASSMMVANFHRMKGARIERYVRGTPDSDLAFSLVADEVASDGEVVKLSELRITYYGGTETLQTVLSSSAKDKGQDKTEKAGKAEKSEKAAKSEKPEKTAGDGQQKKGPKDGEEVEMPALFTMMKKSRVEIYAKSGTYRPETAVGEAEGGVRIEIYSMDLHSSGAEPVAVISSERLRWRAWTNPAVGSSELSLYVVSDDPDKPDPVVQAKLTTVQPDGQRSMMELQANGMIVELAVLDHLTEVTDETGRLIGKTDVKRRRVIFHRDIRFTSVGAASTALIPFQQQPDAAEKLNAKDAAKPPAGELAAPKAPKKPSAPPTLTKIRCNGPGLLDLATRPRIIGEIAPDKQIPLSLRFEFLNGVLMVTRAVTPDPAAKGSDGKLECRHLCLQYPLGNAGSSLPEFAEAIGGVVVEGTKNTQAAVADAKPFRIDAQRMYYDGVSDSIFLEGLPGTPLRMTDDLGDLGTNLLVYSRREQRLSMPKTGPKWLRINPAAMAALAASKDPEKDPKKEPPPDEGAAMLDLTKGGELKVDWYDSFTRMITRIPVKVGEPLQEKEILTFKDRVNIRQPEKDLQLKGEDIRIVRDTKTGHVERIVGSGKVLVRVEGIQVKGEDLAMDLAYDAQGKITKNMIIVRGDPKTGAKAILWEGESAIAGERFEIDVLNNNFIADGGGVARFNLPAQDAGTNRPKEVAGSESMMPKFDMAPGGKVTLQFDGSLKFASADGQLHVTDNVLIHQEGMQILADHLVLRLDPPKPDAPAKTEKKEKPKDGKKEDPKDKKGEKKDPDVKPGIFAGSVRSAECTGRVELKTDSHYIRCDRIFFDMKNQQHRLAADDPSKAVRIYMKDPSSGSKLLQVHAPEMERLIKLRNDLQSASPTEKIALQSEIGQVERQMAKRPPPSLDYDGKTGKFTPTGRYLIMPYPKHSPEEGP